MSQKTKVKNDFLGLYVVAGGWVARPFFGTIFKDGDEVKSHHFGGSSNAGVTLKKYNFKDKERNYEYWNTTGTAYYEYKDWLKNLSNSEFEKKVKESYDWYKKHSISDQVIYNKLNQQFKLKFIEEVIEEVIKESARKEAEEILNLSNKKGLNEFLKYYNEDKFNICCLHLDTLKDKLVKENKMIQSDDDNFGEFFKNFKKSSLKFFITGNNLTFVSTNKQINL